MRKKEVSDIWMLEKTTTLDQLIIHEGAQIHTPDGKFVAMTINGSGTPITPGTYYGDIVLTVADTCHMPPHGLMKMMNRSEEFRCALVINNNEIVKEQSVNELIKGGLVTDRFADSVTIQSSEPSFNGILIKGNSRYQIKNAHLHLEGNGTNDFLGVGAGIAAIDNTHVRIDNCDNDGRRHTMCDPFRRRQQESAPVLCLWEAVFPGSKAAAQRICLHAV